VGNAAEWRTTTRDFYYFQKQAKTWLKRFGLTNYRVIFFHKDGEGPCVGSYGWFKSEGNVANIGLSVTFDRPVSSRLLDNVALHEVLHVLFDDLTHAGTQRFVPMGFIEAEEEQVIARLEKVLLAGKEIG